MEPNVFICVPSTDMVHMEFTVALSALMRQANVRRVSLINQRGSVLPHSRRLLAERALSHDATHLLWLDSDMTFPPMALDRLLAHKQPIVGATYLKRSPPHPLIGQPAESQADVPEGMTAMAYMGFGCVLIEAGVFAAVPKPWFAYDLEADPEVHEDRWFCGRARSAGYQVLCDDWLTMQVGHIGAIIHQVPPMTAEVARAA